MKDKRVFRLVSMEVRNRAKQAIDSAPDGYACTVGESNRSLDQNAKFHAICTELHKTGIKWAGRERNADEWKVLLVSGHAVATKQPAEIVPGIEGEFVNLRESTASMGKARSSSLIEYSQAFLASVEA